MFTYALTITIAHLYLCLPTSTCSYPYLVFSPDIQAHAILQVAQWLRRDFMHIPFKQREYNKTRQYDTL